MKVFQILCTVLIVGVFACGAVGTLSQIQVSTSIAECQAAARLAEAGTNLHVYDTCMVEAGLHDGGSK